MPRNHWVVELPDFPEGHLVPFTAEEEAQADIDAAIGEAREAAQATSEGNERTVRDRLEQALTQLENASGTQASWAALTAPQKDAVLRTTVRVVAGLIRLTLRRLDTAG